MAAPKTKSKFEREERLARISRRRLQGWTQEQIAQEIGCSRQNIGRDLKIIEERWKTEMVQDVSEVKARASQELELLKSEYWSGWERSIGGRETKQLRVKGNDEEKSLREESTPGDPRFLDGARRCVEAKIELFGAGAPKKLDVNDVSKRTTGSLESSLLSIIEQIAVPAGGDAARTAEARSLEAIGEGAGGAPEDFGGAEASSISEGLGSPTRSGGGAEDSGSESTGAQNERSVPTP